MRRYCSCLVMTDWIAAEQSPEPSPRLHWLAFLMGCLQAGTCACSWFARHLSINILVLFSFVDMCEHHYGHNFTWWYVTFEVFFVHFAAQTLWGRNGTLFPVIYNDVGRWLDLSHNYSGFGRFLSWILRDWKKKGLLSKILLHHTDFKVLLHSRQLKYAHECNNVVTISEVLGLSLYFS